MDRLYYISQGKTPHEHLHAIRNFCSAGGKLVQLRIKDCTQETYLQIAKKTQEICTKYKAVLIINDAIEVAVLCNAEGVHLGKQDGSIQEARTVLGPAKIIGGTANTYEDCIALIEQGVDYIGLGPFCFTTTKKGLSPILGLEGYQQIIKRLTTEGYKTPIYAIGGVTESDFEALYQIGIYGIALSGWISNISSEVIQKRLHIHDAIVQEHKTTQNNEQLTTSR